MLPVAILSGGLATRLRPLTDRLPKSLIPIAGRPFIVHQLELLKRQGVDRVVLCVGHLGEQIAAVVGDGRTFGLDVRYSYDGERLLGTGGAVRQALPLLGERFFVLNGDSYLQCSYVQVQSAFEACGRPALMTVLRNDDLWDRSNVTFIDGEIVDYDKTSRRSDRSYIDFGLSVVDGRIIAKYDAAESGDLAQMFKHLATEGQLAGFEMTGRFYEIGSRQGILDTEAYLLQHLESA
jgi:NDP-sugar pyrophosphorylase family protein